MKPAIELPGNRWTEREEAGERPLERGRNSVGGLGRKATESLEHRWIKVTVDLHNDKHNVSERRIHFGPDQSQFGGGGSNRSDWLSCPPKKKK